MLLYYEAWTIHPLTTRPPHRIAKSLKNTIFRELYFFTIIFWTKISLDQNPKTKAQNAPVILFEF